MISTLIIQNATIYYFILSITLHLFHVLYIKSQASISEKKIPAWNLNILIFKKCTDQFVPDYTPSTVKLSFLPARCIKEHFGIRDRFQPMPEFLVIYATTKNKISYNFQKIFFFSIGWKFRLAFFNSAPLFYIWNSLWVVSKPNIMQLFLDKSTNYDKFGRNFLEIL